MPTYVYKCPIHGEFEVEQRIIDARLTVCLRRVSCVACDGGYARGVRRCGLARRELVQCETCGGDNFVPCNQPVERLIAGGTSFNLRGSGWAKDGYK